MRYSAEHAGLRRPPARRRLARRRRIAVQFVLNYEEGGENCILHGDAASEAFLSEIVGAAALARPCATGTWRSIYEYGARAGFWRLHRLFTGDERPGHHLRRRHRARPLARPGRRHAGGRLGDRQPRPEVDRLPERHPRGRGRRHGRGDPAPHRGHRRAAARLVHRPHLGQHRRSRQRGGRLRLRLRHLRRRPALLARARRAASSSIIPYTLDANDMRFARRRASTPGDQFFAYLKDSFDTLYAEGEAGAPEDDVHRPALPADRPPRPRARARPLHRLRQVARQGLVRPPHRHRPRTGAPATRRRRHRPRASAT